MDIGRKLQLARINAGLTQEQVAEALEVSRQTVSNWENDRTDPDIKSIVTISELYHVTLNQLLKDDHPFPAPCPQKGTHLAQPLFNSHLAQALAFKKQSCTIRSHSVFWRVP